MQISKEKLEIIMAKRGLTVEQAANLIKVSRQRLSAIVNSKSCRPSTVAKIAAGLKISIDEIIETETTN